MQRLVRHIAGLLCALGLMAGAGAPAVASEVMVAVAANFLTTARQLGEAFRAETGNRVSLVHGSTGVLQAQIVNGAPYDVFLAADAERPLRLVASGQALRGFTYAYGRLALAVAGEPLPDLSALAGFDGRIAIADPGVAPYGVAAREVLGAIRGAEAWSRNVVFGENVSKALSFLVSGNVQAAMVARAQIALLDGGYQVLEVPEEMHAPIRQVAVLLARAGDDPAARAFYEFLSSPPARALIAAAGYGVDE